MNDYTPRSRKTFFFLGVTTGKSSIMDVFPRWAEHLARPTSICVKAYSTEDVSGSGAGFGFEPPRRPFLRPRWGFS